MIQGLIFNVTDYPKPRGFLVLLVYVFLGLLPGNLGAHTTQDELLKGVGIASLQNEVIALTIFAVVIMGIAALRFRKRLD